MPALVGTSTEIYDYMKLLFAIGRTYSPISGQEKKIALLTWLLMSKVLI
jgi:excinuclease UvrABC ATPase subunit